MSPHPIRLGVVGLSAEGSWASRSHLPYWLKTPHYKVVALLNSSKESAEKAAKAYDLEHVACYGDIEDLVADQNVDAIFVTVKVPLHATILEPALKVKKLVACEWPLARNLAEAKHLASLAQQYNIKTMIGLQGRQDLTVRKAKAMVEAGMLGQILGSTMTARGIILDATITESLAYCADIDNGANLMTIPFGHNIDALCYVLGELSDVQATLAINRREIDVVKEGGDKIRTIKKTSHDYVAVTGHLERGGGVVSVTLKSGNADGDKALAWEIFGTKGNLIIEGSSGFVQMVQPKMIYVPADKSGKTQSVEVDEAKDPSYNVGQSWDAFAGMVEAPVVTFEDAVLRHKMIDAIYRSDKNGTRESYL